GVVVNRFVYLPYGTVTYLDADFQSSTNTQHFPYLFQGMWFQVQTGTYDGRMRVYLPELGKWLQVDPIGYAAGNNDSAFVNDGPVGATDPTGQWKWLEGWAQRNIWDPLGRSYIGESTGDNVFRGFVNGTDKICHATKDIPVIIYDGSRLIGVAGLNKLGAD